MDPLTEALLPVPPEMTSTLAWWVCLCCCSCKSAIFRKPMPWASLKSIVTWCVHVCGFQEKTTQKWNEKLYLLKIKHT